MEFEFKVKIVARLENSGTNPKSQHLGTDFSLEVSSNLNEAYYIDEKGMPTKAGCQALRVAICTALVGNIHFAHQNGLINDVEHLRQSIADIEQGFAAVANTFPSTFKDDK